MTRRVTRSSKVKGCVKAYSAAVAKASLKGRQFDLVDPKPSDLTMARVKSE